MVELKRSEFPFEASDRALAIAIKGTNAPSALRHLSFVYSTSEGLKQLHLAWHKKLSWHLWEGGYQWYEFQGINPILQQTIAENLEALAAVNCEDECVINYSGVYDDDLHYFDDDLKYVDHGLGTGLTCATFVVAVLKRFGINLLVVNSWPKKRLGDVKWLEYILTQLDKLVEKYTNIKSHTAAQRKYKNLLRRLRPEEVAATPIIFMKEPLLFKQVEPHSKVVLGRLPS